MAGFDWFWKAMGGQHGRNQKRSKAIVQRADELRRDLWQLDDAALAARVTNSTVADDPALLLACLSVAAHRTIGMVPFDVQNQAVLRLLEGDVVHMATGEGKTLVGAMAPLGSPCPASVCM